MQFVFNDPSTEKFECDRKLGFALVKPDKIRCWTRSMALRDTDEVSEDIMLGRKSHKKGSLFETPFFMAFCLVVSQIRDRLLLRRLKFESDCLQLYQLSQVGIWACPFHQQLIALFCPLA